LLSPVSSPGVLDNPERRGLGVVVSDQQHSVIRLAVGAGGRISGDDSSGVAEQQVGVQGDGQGSLFNHEGDDVGGVVVQSGPVGDLGNAGVARRARGLLSNVGIVSLVGQTSVGDDVLIGQPWKSSSASSVAQIGLGLQASVRAIDDPLLREGDQRVSRKEPLSLNVLSGGEGPARTAALLVLHGGDCSLGSPVEGGWDGNSVDFGNSVVWPDASVVDLEWLHQP